MTNKEIKELVNVSDTLHSDVADLEKQVAKLKEELLESKRARAVLAAQLDLTRKEDAEMAEAFEEKLVDCIRNREIRDAASGKDWDKVADIAEEIREYWC